MNNWNNYIYYLHQRIDKQDQLIHSLESRMQDIENDNNQEKKQTVEKVEYNFDQLKIENLEGTLHIGLSPNDLKNIDDLSVPGSGSSTFKQQLLSELKSYLHRNGEQLIQEIAQEHQIPSENIDPAVLTEDIANQLPDRIAFYEQEAKRDQRNLNEEETKTYIADQIKHEIRHSLSKYMEGNDNR
ncbi:spore germination protein GerPC [Lentibacillus juripiscarius]|uniref:Spore germination protein GerPC n=1 Tax=Lentibacillus juripiscarius TaxID=257446 RepID=A0ABW5V747_9BACI